jgi:hypothetical protein
MSTYLQNLIPEEISDETAYHLTNFVMALATELDSLLYGQVKRYLDTLHPSNLPEEIDK